MLGIFGKPKEELLTKISEWCIGVLFFLIPLFFIPWNSVGVELAKMFLFVTLTSVGLLALLIQWIRKKELIFLASRWLWTLVLIPVVTGLSALGSIHTSSSLLGSGFEVGTFGFILFLFGLIALVIAVVDTKGKALNLYLLFFAALLLLGIFHVIRLVFGHEVLTLGVFNHATASLIGGWFDMAGFFGIGIVLGVLALEELDVAPSFKGVLYVVLALSLFFLIVVNVKIVWWVVFAVMCLYGVHQFMQVGDNVKRFSWRVLVVGLISLSGIIFSGYIGNVVADKMDLEYVEVSPQVSTTITIGQDILDEKMFLGTGPNTFTYAWERHKPLEINRTIFWNTNFTFGSGFIPTVFATGGLFSIIAWVLFFVMLIRFGIVALRTYVDDAFTRYLLLSSFFATVYVWVFATLYAPGVAFLVLAGAITGIYIATLGYIDMVDKTKRSFKDGVVIPFVLPALVLLVLLFGYGYATRFIGLWHFNTGVDKVGNAQIEEGLASIDTALTWFGSGQFYRAQAEVHLIRLKEVLEKPDVTQAEVEGIFAQAVGSAQRATRFNPYNFENWVTLGRVYAHGVPLRVSGAGEFAFTALGEAARLSPKHPRISIAFADVAISAGDYSTAREYIEQARAQKPDYATAFMRSADLLLLEGDRNGALEILETGSTIAKHDPSLPFRQGLIYYEMRAYTSALEKFEESLERNPEYANAEFYKAGTLYMLGDSETAMGMIEDMLLRHTDVGALQEAQEAMRNGTFGGSQQPVIETDELSEGDE